jgi:pseudomonalisin
MRRLTIGALVAAAIAFFAVPAGGAAAIGGIAAHVAGLFGSGSGGGSHSRTVSLSGDVLPGIAKAQPVGAPETSTQVTLAVGLRDRNVAAENRVLAALSDPTSPSYHHFLTPDQFAAQFGPSDGQYRAVIGWLRSGGLSVVSTSKARDLVEVTGAVARIDALFHTQIRTFHSTAGDVYANVTAPTVPGDLDILGVTGLNNVQHFVTTQSTAPKATTSGTPVPQSTLTPQDLWGIYQQPQDNQGQGETMAIFGAGDSTGIVAGLRNFEKQNKLPVLPVSTTYVPQGTPYPDLTGDDVEWYLDTQASTGMAPQVQNLHLYFGKDLSDASVLNVFNQWADDNVDKQASASYGECETSPADPAISSAGLGNALEPLAEQTLTRANLQGQTLFSSTGDTGAYCPDIPFPVNPNGVLYTGDPRLNYPAASSHVVAVGGSVVWPDSSDPSKATTETAWTHGGGGNSVMLAAGDYQTKYKTANSKCVVDYGGGTSSTGGDCRGTPDVAAESGDVIGDGYTICTPGCSVGGAGTSLSSPLWLGMWTRIQAAAADPASGLGFADEVLYKFGATPGLHGPDFTDITVGTNGLYTALPGWDNTSGWGSPMVTNLLLDIDGKTKPTNDIPPPPVSVAPPVSAGSLLSPVACNPLWTVNPPKKVTDASTTQEEKQLELASGNMTLSRDGQTLQVLITVADLGANGVSNPASPPVAAPPPGSDGEAWLMTWTSAAGSYFAGAQRDATGAVQYRVGTVSSGSTTSYNPTSTTLKGNIDTARNLIEIDVPLADIGSPGPGTVLKKPAGQTWELVGAPSAAGGGGTFNPADSSSAQNDYTVGAVCGTPPATLTIPAPQGGTGFPYPYGAASSNSTAPQPQKFPAAAAPAAGNPSASGTSGPPAVTKPKPNPNGITIHTVSDGALGSQSPLPIQGLPIGWLLLGAALSTISYMIRKRPKG